jgi:hypothetical protein
VNEEPPVQGPRKDFFNRLAGRLKDRHQLAHQGKAARWKPHWKTEIAMSTFTQPPKDVVRAYLERRARDPKPPPSPEEIRRQLGWGMAPSDFKMASSPS